MKKTIKPTESDLHRVIKESVKRVLKEEFYNKFGEPIGIQAKEIDSINDVRESYELLLDFRNSWNRGMVNALNHLIECNYGNTKLAKAILYGFTHFNEYLDSVKHSLAQTDDYVARNNTI